MVDNGIPALGVPCKRKSSGVDAVSSSNATRIAGHIAFVGPVRVASPRVPSTFVLFSQSHLAGSSPRDCEVASLHHVFGFAATYSVEPLCVILAAAAVDFSSLVGADRDCMSPSATTDRPHDTLIGLGFVHSVAHSLAPSTMFASSCDMPPTSGAVFSREDSGYRSNCSNV